MLEKYRLLKNHCKWTLQVCCIFEGIFVILSLMTLKLGNSEQNCEKKKCFKGFKTLGRRSRVLTNRGCKVLHTKFSLRSPSSHAGNAALPFCAGVENKQCFSPPLEERGGEQGWAGGMEHPPTQPASQPAIPPSLDGPGVRAAAEPRPRAGRSFGVTQQLFLPPRLLLSRTVRRTNSLTCTHPRPSKFKALGMA